MGFTKAFALAAIFATLSAAAPVHQKRALVYETVTEVDVTTIDTTITVYPGEATPTVASVYTTEAAVTSTPPAETAVAATSTVAPSPLLAAEITTSPTPAPAAPETSTTAAPVPTTTVAPPAPAITTSSSSTSTAPAATPTGTSSSRGSGLSGTGDGTYYDTATSLSAPSYCDTANDGTSENVVALSQAVMNESLCGATITVTYEGKTVTGTVVDKCMGCDAQSIDMSRAMFGDLASLDAGRVTVSWSV